MIRAIGTALCVGALLLVGCGSDSNTSNSGGTQTSFNESNDAAYTEQQVAERAGLTQDDSGISWVGPNGCQVSVIMTTRDAIETYASAGDAVVTNPAGTVGVKFYPDTGCRDALSSALKNVK